MCVLGEEGGACVYVDWPAVSDLDVTVVLCGATSIAYVNVQVSSKWCFSARESPYALYHFSQNFP